jgi:hypothetical protein
MFKTFIAVVIIMFRKAARGLASLEPPMPFIAWREELQEMAAGLRSANPLATSGQCQSERISDNYYRTHLKKAPRTSDLWSIGIQ